MPAAPPNKPSAPFTSRKLTILNACCADPRVNASHFRFFVRVLAGINEDGEVGVLSDDTIADEVPGYKQQSSCFRARKALQALGWLNCEPGRGTKATRYSMGDGPVAGVKAVIDQLRERRAEERQTRNGALKRRQSNPAGSQGKARSSPAHMHGKNEIQPCGDAGLEPGPTLQIAYVQPCGDAGSTPYGTPSTPALRPEGVTQGLPTAPPDRWGLPPILDDECASDCGRMADHVAKFQVEGKWRLRPICAECVVSDYAIQRGDAEAYRLPGQ